MSNGKWVIYEGYMVDKMSEIVDRLKVDIECEKHREKLEKEQDRSNPYPPTEPYQNVLSILEGELRIIQRMFVKTNREFDDDYEISLTEYQQKRFPQWKHLFDSDCQILDGELNPET